MKQLLADVEAFLAKHEMHDTPFGQRALGDRHLVRTLRSGRRLWPETEAKVREFMRNWEVGSVHADRITAPEARNHV